MIHINVDHHKLTAVSDEPLVAKCVGVVQFEAKFDSSWDGYQRKIVFAGSAGETSVLYTDGIMEVPWQVMDSDGRLHISAVGLADGKRNVTVVMGNPLYINRNGSLGENPADPPPAPSILEQAQMACAKSAEEARDAEKEAVMQAAAAKQDALSASESKEAAMTAAETTGNAANRASASEENAKTSEENADQSEQAAAQALADLLRMLGTDIPQLVGGVLPMSVIPATATQEIYEVTSPEGLVDLIAQRGDLAELVEMVDGERTITKTWQLLGEDASVWDNWVVWGTSYAVQAGSATTAKSAENAARINGHRMVEMTEEAFKLAAKDPDTYYLVYTPEVTI